MICAKEDTVVLYQGISANLSTYLSGSTVIKINLNLTALQNLDLVKLKSVRKEPLGKAKELIRPQQASDSLLLPLRSFILCLLGLTTVEKQIYCGGDTFDRH